MSDEDLFFLVQGKSIRTRLGLRVENGRDIRANPWNVCRHLRKKRADNIGGVLGAQVVESAEEEGGSRLCGLVKLEVLQNMTPGNWSVWHPPITYTLLTMQVRTYKSVVFPEPAIPRSARLRR